MNRWIHWIVILFAALSLIVTALPAQPSASETVGQPWVGAKGITQSVQEIMDRQARQPDLPYSGPVRDREEMPLRPTPKDNPFAPQISSWPSIDKTRTSDERQVMVSPQTVGASFATISLAAGESPYIPPDCGADVGPTQVLVHLNGRIKVFSKTGVLGALNAKDTTFWSPVRNGQDVSDPHVRYDRIAKRWVVVAINLASSNNRILIAVSSDSVITGSGSFTFYQFSHNALGTQPNSDTNGFADYPTLGVDANAFYIGANIFNAAGTAVVGTTGYVVRKSAIYTGSLVVTAFRQLTNGNGTTGFGPWTPQGVDNDDPAAAEGYFIGVDFVNYSQLDIRRVTNPGGTPTISSNIILTVPATGAPILQPHLGEANPNRRLDALDDRLFAAQLKKNKLTGVSTLWTAHNIAVNSSGVAASGSRNGSRWYEIGSMTTTPTLVQSGTLFDGAASNPRGYWIPSVAMSGQGHMALGSSYAGLADHAGVSVAGRFSSDALGTMQSPTLAVISTTNYNVENTDGQRWGDYSQTVVDPNDDMTFWTFQEYCDATNSWGMRAVQLKAPLPAAPTSASPSSIIAGVSNASVTIAGTSSGGTGFFDPGPGYTGRISASVSGSGVTVNSVTFSSPTSITLNVTVAPGAAPGTRTVTVTNPDGQSSTSASGILTVTGGSCGTITLAPASLSNGAAGSPYSQSITASGGTGPYTYAVTAGALPAGVTLSSGGLLSGTPTYGGIYNFSVTATDANFCTGVQAYAWTVTGCPQLALSPSTLPGDTIGVAYNQTVTSSGGTGPYSYTVTAGALPSGISLSSGGVFSGSATTAGSYNFTVQSTDANLCAGARAYTIQTYCPAIVLSPASMPGDTVGKSYSQTITSAGGTPAYAYSVTAGSLPTGLTLTSGGLLSGTLAAAGSYSFTVTSTDGIGCTGTRAYALTVYAVVVPNTMSLAAQGTAVVENFDVLASTGATGSVFPTGWFLSETGSNANATYGVDSGGMNAGNTYSYGSTNSSDRAFGTLLSGSVNSTIGASITNHTGATITSLEFSYVGEQWRLGTLNRTDSLVFQMSTDATTITTGTWTSYPQLTFASPVITGSTGAKDGNSAAFRTSKSATISGLSIPNGAEFFVRWTDFNATSSDDGLAVDSFAVTANPGGGSPTNPTAAGSASPSSVVVGNTTLLRVTVTPGSNPASTGITVSADLSSIGGSASQPFFNDGTNGDVTIGDNIWSYRATIGIAVTPGATSLPVSVADAQARSAGASINLTVLACPTITVTPATLPNAGLGVAYNQQLSSTGGTGASTYALQTPNTLPAGLSLSSGGAISGTATALGTSNFTVVATDSNGCTGSNAYSLQVACPAMTITPATLPNGTLGAAYLQLLSGSGGTSPYTFSVGSGTLPAGLTLGASGQISGTPTLPGTANFTVALADSNGCQDSLAYALTIGCAAIAISPDSLSAGTAGSAYNALLSATGGTGAISYSVTAGSLPPGVVLGASGHLTGTPSASGSYPFTVSATDTLGCTGAKAYTLQVNCTAVTVTPASVTDMTKGTFSSEQFGASGGTAPYSYQVSAGAVPSGMALSPSGLLSGTPSAADSVHFTVTATDTFGCQGSHSYAFRVDCPVITILPASLADDSVWHAISDTITASGGTGPYTFSVTAGSLPPGVSLSSSGALGGSATSSGLYAFTVSAVGTDLCGGSRAYSWQINPSSQVHVDVPIEPRWNIVSNPINAGPGAVATLFPAAVSDAFSYVPSSGYVSTLTMTPGLGYWLKFGSAATATIQGVPLLGDSVPVQGGWNLVGALAQPIAASSVVPIGTTIQSQFYRYQNGYSAADTILPGTGYWVSTTGTGTLVFSAGTLSMKPIAVRPADEQKPLLSIAVSDAAGGTQELALVPAGSAAAGTFSGLPPAPPKGVFDVRFAGDKMTEVFASGRRKEYLIRVAAAAFPVTIGWSRSAAGEERMLLVGTDAAKAPFRAELIAEGSVTLRSAQDLRLIVEPKRAVPTSFALLQNYPNPFNPTTTMQFDLPLRSSVTLVVLNILGEELARLYDKEDLGPGREEVSFDASRLPSGIYFYRMSAVPIGAEGAKEGQGYTSTRKMILVK